MANLFYVLIVALSAVASVSLRYNGIDLNVGFDVGISGPSVCIGNATECGGAAFAYSICDSDNCKGYWAVYRICFTLTGFFFLMALATACPCECSTRIHRGFWFFKVCALAATLAGSIFAPNDLFASYAWIARFVSPLFLLYQLLIFIDFGYSMNDKLVQADERMDDCCFMDNQGFKHHCLILVISLLLYVVAFTAIGLLYAFWPMSCAFNPLAITTTLLFGLLNTAVSISKAAEHGSLLCSAIIFFYCVWLCYASLAAHPDPACNVLQRPKSEVGWIGRSGDRCTPYFHHRPP